jgi:RNA polymerase sigma-70 factor (ECF subfamily)
VLGGHIKNRAFPFEWQLAGNQTTSVGNADEHELIKGVQSGDVKAIETLYNSYFDRLYLYVFHSVNGNKSIAEDITQETFVGVFKAARQFKGKSKLFTWLVGIAHHKIIDYYRHQSRESIHNNGLINSVPTNIQSVTTDRALFIDALESTELRLVVSEALSAMPLDYRQVLLFKYVEDMKIMEISQVMDRSPKAIDGLLTRARKLLKENLYGKV